MGAGVGVEVLVSAGIGVKLEVGVGVKVELAVGDDRRVGIQAGSSKITRAKFNQYFCLITSGYPLAMPLAQFPAHDLAGGGKGQRVYKGNLAGIFVRSQPDFDILLDILP